MTTTLPMHGTEQGYNAELKTGDICGRCRAAHRVWSRRKTKKGQGEGLRQYSSNDVIDHLDLRRSRPRSPAGHSGGSAQAPPASHDGDEPAPGPPDNSSPGIGERLGDGLRQFLGSPDYVPDEEIPDYLHAVTPDPEPDGQEWAPVSDYVITAGMRQTVQDNMATYLSVLGMTLDIVDPYCGPIAAANIENMVNRWSKVVLRYPKATKLFMSESGGAIMDWIGALQATWPLLLAGYEHHLARTVTIIDGQPMRRSGVGFPDPTLPDNYDYSAG